MINLSFSLLKWRSHPLFKSPRALHDTARKVREALCAIASTIYLVHP
ncbi:MAG: hypothetical protein AB1589_04135 [Cyanobacteriota bacterium]